jgi:twitching motility protein PilT
MATAFNQTKLWERLRTWLTTHRDLSDFIIDNKGQLIFVDQGELNLDKDFKVDIDDFMLLMGELRNHELLDDEDSSREHFSVDAALSVDGLRFRGALYRYMKGYRIVLRPLQAIIPEPSSINMPDQLLDLGATLDRGLILICGPTGAGKTTTTASFLKWRGARRREHIITLEDPIEYTYPEDTTALYSQREVGTHVESFAKGLRSALRQRPHVILVGEIRDQDTAEVALQAAETGHLVLASFHTGTPEEAVQRYLQLIPESRQEFTRAILATVLELVICQKLITLSNGKRFAIHEVMRRNPAISNCIRKGNWTSMRQQISLGKNQGQQDFKLSLEIARNKHLIDEAAYQKWLPLVTVQAPGE